MPEPAEDPDDDVTDLVAEALRDSNRRIIDFGYILASLKAFETSAHPSKSPSRDPDPHTLTRRPALTDDALRRAVRKTRKRGDPPQGPG